MHVPNGHAGLVFDRTSAIVRPDALDAVREILRAGTLYDHARGHASRTLNGRLPAYVVRLDARLSIVVRHNTHGGALARVTGDRFLPPTRAPLELEVALRLRAAGVDTPPVVAIARYRGMVFERADVATEEIPDALDLATAMQQEPAAWAAAAQATGTLLRALTAAGVRHADLNLKNVLLQRSDDGCRAWLLDVDRVSFHRPGSRLVHWRNWRRFARSARKWRKRWGAPISEEWLASVAQHAAPARRSP